VDLVHAFGAKYFCPDVGATAGRYVVGSQGNKVHSFMAAAINELLEACKSSYILGGWGTAIIQTMHQVDGVKSQVGGWVPQT
jgi:hypothetical protein